MSVADETPIVIGVGEASERIDAVGYQALSPVGLASRAAEAALADAGAPGLAAHVDLIAAIRSMCAARPGAPASASAASAAFDASATGDSAW